MKGKTTKAGLLLILIAAFSCNEPKTIVTNIVHQDGSVTRRIEMRNNENKFEISSLQVPFDSTWIIKDTLVIGEKGDSTWVKTAEKFFKNAEAINEFYRTDKGANKDLSRKAGFIKKFKWFYTEYRFSEWIDKKMNWGYPVRDYLGKDELLFFYSPESINDEKLKSTDSLKYKALKDTMDIQQERWELKNIASEWINEFSKLTEGKGRSDISKESLKAREDQFAGIIRKYEPKFDSIWEKGIILKEFINEANAAKYRKEADSAMSIATNRYFVNFKNYSVRIVMPGKVIGTNGFIDKTEGLFWPVKSEYFLTEPYEMWAESKVSNPWEWIVTGIFLVFVITGLLLKAFRK
jgi:hypothetical protein